MRPIPIPRSCAATCLFLASCLFVVAADARQVGTCPRSLGEAYLDINNVRARILNTGGLFYRGEPSVYEVPRGSGIHSIFALSTWFAGRIEGELRASAARNGRDEMWAGPLDDAGNPPADCGEYDRLYKVSKNDIEAYVRDGTITEDLRDWPTGLGAPTRDPDGNLVSLSTVSFKDRRDRKIKLSDGERPAIMGDQSIWWVMNDRGNVHAFTGLPPLGIEVHGLAFAAARGADFVNNTTLYTLRIFNKNDVVIEDAFIGIYVDSDLGNFADDFVGSDSLRNMGYTYNADDDDNTSRGYGIGPPALGVIFLDGPPAETDKIDNDRNGIVDEAGERLTTSCVGWFSGDGAPNGDPQFGLHYYNYLRCRWVDGSRYTVGDFGFHSSAFPTNFIWSGDPGTSSFWSEMNYDGLGSSHDSGG